MILLIRVPWSGDGGVVDSLLWSCGVVEDEFSGVSPSMSWKGEASFSAPAVH